MFRNYKKLTPFLSDRPMETSTWYPEWTEMPAVSQESLEDHLVSDSRNVLNGTQGDALTQVPNLTRVDLFTSLLYLVFTQHLFTE